MYSRQALLTYTGLPEARTPSYYYITLKGEKKQKKTTLYWKKNLIYWIEQGLIGKIKQVAICLIVLAAA